MSNLDQQNTEDNVITKTIILRIVFILIMLLSATYIALDLRYGKGGWILAAWGFNFGAAYASLSHSFANKS